MLSAYKCHPGRGGSLPGEGALEYTIFMKRHHYICESLCSVYRGRSEKICNIKFDAVLIQKVFSQNPQRREHFMFESAHIYHSKKTSITLCSSQSSFFSFLLLSKVLCCSPIYLVWSDGCGLDINSHLLEMKGEVIGTWGSVTLEVLCLPTSATLKYLLSPSFSFRMASCVLVFWVRIGFAVCFQNGWCGLQRPLTPHEPRSSQTTSTDCL